jgi:cyclopropane-fatty-acyl-phospholipid synthase
MPTRQPAAEQIAAAVRTVLGTGLPLGLRCWDGSVAGPADAPATLVLRNRRALRRLLFTSNEIGLGRAFVAGDIEVEGDLFAALAAVQQLAERERPRLDPAGYRSLAVTAARLGALGPPPLRPQEEARLSGPLHSRRRDAAAISHHYDVGNDFYRLVLGPTMTYSCAYWVEPSYTLDDAQLAKCELVCRKLGLQPGLRVLDVGCGWGTFVIHAAAHHGVEAVGITLSENQVDLARKRVAEAGLSERVTIRLQDYRDVHDGPYDAIASIGMAEHVGAGMLPAYADALFGLLRPEGRLLNHAIARRPGPPSPRRASFIQRYVFPDGELVPVADMVAVLEDRGFEVRDVEALREHYGRTLRAWVGNLQGSWAEAVRLSAAGRARVWLLYMAGSALSFEANRIGVNQVLAVRVGPAGRSGMPATRAGWTVPAVPAPARRDGEDPGPW